MAKPKLLPCPFCAGKALFQIYVDMMTAKGGVIEVYCRQCGVRRGQAKTPRWKRPAEWAYQQVANEWNERMFVPPHQLPREPERLSLKELMAALPRERRPSRRARSIAKRSASS